MSAVAASVFVLIFNLISSGFADKQLNQCDNLKLKMNKTMHGDLTAIKCYFYNETGMLNFFQISVSNKPTPIGSVIKNKPYLEQNNVFYELILLNESVGLGAILASPYRHLKGEFMCELKVGDCVKTEYVVIKDLADGDRGCTDPEIQCDTDGAVCSSNMCVCPDCKKGPDNQESGDPWQGFGIGIVVILVVIVAVGLFNICKMKKQIKALEKAAKDHARIVTSTNLTQGPRAAIQESSSGLGTMTTLQNTKKDDVVLELDASKETDMADESFCLMASNTDAVSLKTGGEPDLAV
ncbi:uncharacterized protein LOC127841630 isoform X2 [Dreissena polymorpha]|nr:uncharacterized protein LOC127841630 isoform X2 [Dreissena polymorpha]